VFRLTNRIRNTERRVKETSRVYRRADNNNIRGIRAAGERGKFFRNVFSGLEANAVHRTLRYTVDDDDTPRLYNERSVSRSPLFRRRTCRFFHNVFQLWIFLIARNSFERNYPRAGYTHHRCVRRLPSAVFARPITRGARFADEFKRRCPKARETYGPRHRVIIARTIKRNDTLIARVYVSLASYYSIFIFRLIRVHYRLLLRLAFFFSKIGF